MIHAASNGTQGLITGAGRFEPNENLVLGNQCTEVARFKTGMPVSTGILVKMPVFRPFICDSSRFFVIFSISDVVYKVK